MSRLGIILGVTAKGLGDLLFTLAVVYVLATLACWFIFSGHIEGLTLVKCLTWPWEQLWHMFVAAWSQFGKLKVW